MAPNTAAGTTTYEVHLAIYDLSGGMAQSLSTQFLGPDHAIDILPHTAIVAYGLEYFFGAGIESCPPDAFRNSRGIRPVEVRPLGRTSTSRADFERWCDDQARSGNYGPESYDLLTKNCNNFAHDAATRGLSLPSGVPGWILDVPRRFLSSPMGAMVRPMLEGMQMRGTPPTGGGGGGGGFGGGGFSGGGPGGFGGRMGSFGPPPPRASAPPPAASAVNPWANIPAAAAPPASPSVPPTTAASTTAPAAAKSMNGGTPCLDRMSKGPLLSTDASIVPACASRLSSSTADGEPLRPLLEKLGDCGAAWSAVEHAAVHAALRGRLSNAKDSAFALMLLRLAVLRGGDGGACEESTAEIATSTRLVSSCLLTEEEVEGRGEDGEKSAAAVSLTGPKRAAARSLAWCVLSNAVGSTDPPAWMVPCVPDSGAAGVVGAEEKKSEDDAGCRHNLDALVDGAVRDLGADRKAEVRRSAAAFLYNAARAIGEEAGGSTDGEDDEEGSSRRSDELPDAAVSVLCGALDGLEDEGDGEALRRRILAAGALFQSRLIGRTATGLARDLGMAREALDAVAARGGTAAGVSGGRDVAELARDVASLLD